MFFEPHRQALWAQAGCLGMALVQLLGNLPQREPLLARYLHLFLQKFIREFARCAALVATQYAHQAPGSVGFGPVVQRLVAHLQQLANVRHLVARCKASKPRARRRKSA